MPEPRGDDASTDLEAFFDRVEEQSDEADRSRDKKCPGAAVDDKRLSEKAFKEELRLLIRQDRAHREASHQEGLEGRKRFGDRIFWLTVFWLTIIILLLIAQGFNLWGFRLSTGVLIALITTTTLGVAALLHSVLKFLFPSATASPDT